MANEVWQLANGPLTLLGSEKVASAEELGEAVGSLAVAVVGVTLMPRRLCIFALLLVTSLPAVAAELTSAQLEQKVILETCLQSYPSRYDALENCIGRTHTTCMAQEADASFSARMGYCYSGEGVLWRAITEDFFAQLVVQVECTDPSRHAQGMPGALDSLRLAHAAWQDYIGKSRDGEFVSLRWGMGTLRIDDPQRHWRDTMAERATLYREWLQQPEWNCP